ncbi:MAG: hypothetical protein M1823_002855 [Watsoniomyces obsoletus]|nr:MAG: hypothetical protein M1823_002855 [Watsoniomyces obsoletus]
MANTNAGLYIQAPTWYGTILPSPDDSAADEWETIYTGDPDDDAEWEDIDHLETASGDTNWYEAPVRSGRLEKDGEPGRVMKLRPPWTRFRVRANRRLPPLPREPPRRPKRPVRDSVLSMIPCGVIDDRTKHTSSQRRGWWIQSGTTAYCRIIRRRNRGQFSSFYYHQYVAADGTQAPKNSIWFTRHFIDNGVERYLREAEDRHRRWYHQARRAYFRFLRVWQREQLAWEEEVFNLVVNTGRVEFLLTWSPLPYIYPGDLPSEPLTNNLDSEESDDQSDDDEEDDDEPEPRGSPEPKDGRHNQNDQERPGTQQDD